MTLTLFMSILSTFEAPVEFFLFDDGLELDFCTLKATLVGDGTSVVVARLTARRGEDAGVSLPQ